jgi:hypothetical protein
VKDEGCKHVRVQWFAKNAARGQLVIGWGLSQAQIFACNQIPSLAVEGTKAFYQANLVRSPELMSDHDGAEIATSAANSHEGVNSTGSPDNLNSAFVKAGSQLVLSSLAAIDATALKG